MKFQILSDLHLEWGYNPEVFSPANIKGDVLLLAGDMHVDPKELYSFLKTINSVPIFIILGNHEFYGKDLYDAQIEYQNVLHHPEERIYFLNNTFQVWEDYVIHGATLWSDFSNSPDRDLIEMSLSDFRRITFEKMPVDTNLLEIEFQNSRHELITELLQFPDKKHIVLTHHAPSFQSIAMQYVGDPINRAFASDMDDLILEYRPPLWVHGHTHTSFNYTLGSTRIVCNPFGYLNHEENPKFKPELVIEL